MDKKTIFVAVLAVIVVIAGLLLIVQRSQVPKPDQGAKTPGQNQGQNNSGGPGDSACALETCHGMDIQCGANPPDVCTDVYELGDRCLRYAKCGMVGGSCQQIPDTQFTSCRSCVQDCSASFENDRSGLFNCESKCPTDNNPNMPTTSSSPASQQTSLPVAETSERKAIDMAYPQFYDFESQPSVAGREVKTMVKGADSYFAYIEYGSGVPILKATCFKVGAALAVVKAGEFPNPTTPVGIYKAIDPTTCDGIK